MATGGEDNNIFSQKVRDLIPSDEDKENLFEALRNYQSSQNLLHLLEDLRYLIDEPNKLELYEFMRPLILMRHQIEYSKRVPAGAGTKLRAVRLQRRAGESLGFAVRGGYEHGVGLFVTFVTRGSQADKQGLKAGDEVVRVNGFTIAEAIHDDILNLIRSREEIILKVTHIGMIPVKEEPTDTVSWKYVDPLEKEDDADNKEVDIKGRKKPQDIRIFIDSTGHASIGCAIQSYTGRDLRFRCIFVESVKAGSLGEEVGLEPGDQIMEVNEKVFRNITSKEALLALKSSSQLNMVIRKKAGTRIAPNVLNKTNNTQPSSTAAQNLPSDSNSLANSNSISQRDQTSPSRESFIRSYGEDEILDQAKMIQQRLNLKAFSSSGQNNFLPSPDSSISAGSSVISTSAEVHASRAIPFKASSEQTPRGVTTVSVSSEPFRSSPLDGAAAARAAGSWGGNVPSLLSAQGDFEWTDNVPWNLYQQFDSSTLDGRLLNCITYKKNADLGIAIEGGLGSPLGGKIVVAMVFEGGVAHESGKMKVGDQLMMVNGAKMVQISAADGERILSEAKNTLKDMVEVYYCQSLFVNDEDDITYF